MNVESRIDMYATWEGSPVGQSRLEKNTARDNVAQHMDRVVE